MTRFNWNGRTGRTLNKNDVDEVNSLLNLGYAILSQRITEILLQHGFEVSIGLMHHDSNNYWNQLSYDMVEPWRVIIDDEVKNMVRNSIIEPDDFKFSQDRRRLIIKDRPLEKVLDRYVEALERLEFKSRSMIKKVESILA